MSLIVELWTIIRCSECGKELHSSNDWALCKRKHTVERMSAQTYQDLTAAGFKDEPDHWLIEQYKVEHRD